MKKQAKFYQRKFNYQKTMDTWDLMINWNLVLPPSRPSKWQLDWISSHIKHLDLSSPVAVLGSTPEYRDHLYELGFRNIFVLDKNEVFYQTVSKSRIYQNKEIFIHGDWLDTLEKFPQNFSVILSDLTSGNIAYENRKRFYELITNALSDKGIFCDKVLTHPDSNLLLQNIFEKYLHLPLNLLHINHFSCEALFCSELLDKEFIVDSTKFYTELQNSAKHPRLQAFIRQAELITPKDCIWYYGKKWHELEKSYCCSLKRIDEKEDSTESPYFRRAKFFVHQKV